jgi:endoglucanase
MPSFNLNEHLKSLISTSGLSGYEKPARELIAAAWCPLTDELLTSRLGSLYGLRRGSLPEPRPSLLLAAHMDAIGLMVTGQVDGWLRVTAIGGVDARTLPGLLVTVHGREDLPGVVVQPPAHLLPEDTRAQAALLETLLVDTGLLPAELAALVRVGDLISFAQPPIELGGDHLAGHSLDNRASVAAVTHCLSGLQDRLLKWDVWAVATVQEEVTRAGAHTAGFELNPTAAIVLDVTFASAPGNPTHQSFALGKGITLGWGPNIHPVLFDALKELADELEIPYKVEPIPRLSSTDADFLQTAVEGIPTLVISIPVRYMHTAVEMVAFRDIARLGRLLTEFAARLDGDFLGRLAYRLD